MATPDVRLRGYNSYRWYFLPVPKDVRGSSETRRRRCRDKRRIAYRTRSDQGNRTVCREIGNDQLVVRRHDLRHAGSGAGLPSWWPVRLLFSLLTAMSMVRTFITHHDYMHRAILVRSRIAWVLFRVYSALALTSPRSWRKSHNQHHGHVGQLSSSSIGAFPIMTTQMWHEASRATRTSYRIVRHPLTVLAG